MRMQYSQEHLLIGLGMLHPPTNVATCKNGVVYVVLSWVADINCVNSANSLYKNKRKSLV